MRTHTENEVATAYSDDQGVTWKGLGLTGVGSPNAGVDAIRLTDGRVVLVHNTPLGRRALAVSMSYDFGESYEQVALLENEEKNFKRVGECILRDIPDETDGPEFSYPTIIQSPSDGLLHITYTFTYYGSGGRCSGRENVKHIILDPCHLGDVSRAPMTCAPPKHQMPMPKDQGVAQELEKHVFPPMYAHKDMNWSSLLLADSHRAEGQLTGNADSSRGRKPSSPEEVNTMVMVFACCMLMLFRF